MPAGMSRKRLPSTSSTTEPSPRATASPDNVEIDWMPGARNGASSATSARLLGPGISVRSSGFWSCGCVGVAVLAVATSVSGMVWAWISFGRAVTSSRAARLAPRAREEPHAGVAVEPQPLGLGDARAAHEEVPDAVREAERHLPAVRAVVVQVVAADVFEVT